MSFNITRSQLFEYTSRAQFVNEARAKQPSAPVSAQVTVFLSHSHKDKDLVKPAVNFLNNQGVRVYVDWLDSDMPAEVSAETAVKIRAKIKENRKFVMLSSENSLSSRWVPWELGFCDGEKNGNHLAVFPISNDNGVYTGNEYVRLYPQIQYINGEWWVYLSNSVTPTICVKLKDWLTS
jgi:hypothetical protein